MKLEQPEQIFNTRPDHPSLVTSKTERDRHAITNRVCSLCGSNKTMETRRFGKQGQVWIGYDWRKDADGNIICKNCDSKLRYPDRREYYRTVANPRTHTKWAPRIFQYKNKRLYADREVRTGVCSRCGRAVESGEIKRTNLHHKKYDDKKPLLHTVELCIACHLFRHNRGKDPLTT